MLEPIGIILFIITCILSLIFGYKIGEWELSSVWVVIGMTILITMSVLSTSLM